MSNMLTYLNILILAWLNVLSICDSEWVVDSDQIYGIKEPDGFTRENISCAPELSIVITSIVYGYKVRNDLVNSEELDLGYKCVKLQVLSSSRSEVGR